MILLPFALAGCHVFEGVAIDCASDEACARGPKDGNPGDDTAVDTDTDTAPSIVSTVGWVISGSGRDGGIVAAFSPDGEPLMEWSGFGDGSGPVAYDAATGMAIVAASGMLGLFHADGTVTSTNGYSTVESLRFSESMLYVTTGTDCVGFDPAAGTSSAAFGGSLTGAEGLGEGPDGTVYISATDDGSPDLYQWKRGGTLTMFAIDFDTTASRARMVFAGPDDAPYTCSTAGAVYAVADLAEGRSAPVVYYAGGLTDVSACAYDPGDETWLLFSATGGVVRMDGQGRGEVVFAAPTAYTPVAASFF